MVDNIDGSTDDVATGAFSLGDSLFAIDLNTTHREELESVLERFIAVVRPVREAKPARPRRPTASPRTDRELTHTIQQWAKYNGHEVSERGRISKAIIEATKPLTDPTSSRRGNPGGTRKRSTAGATLH